MSAARRRPPGGTWARACAATAAAALLVTGCSTPTAAPGPPAAPVEGTASAAPSVEPSSEPSLGPVELVDLAQDAVLGLRWDGCRWAEEGRTTTGWAINEQSLLTSGTGLDLTPQVSGAAGQQDGELASGRTSTEASTGRTDLGLVDLSEPTGALLTWQESVQDLDGLVAVGWSPERGAVTATPVSAQDVQTDGRVLSFSTAEELPPWLVGAPVLGPGGQVAGIVVQETLLDDTVGTRVLTYAGVEPDFVDLVFDSSGPRRSLCSLTQVPWTYGDDDERDDLWDACVERTVEACDELAAVSEPGSDYHQVGASCGGLGEPDGSCAEQTWPADADPVFARGQDADLDALRRSCVRDDLLACDQLWDAAGADTSYARAAGFCGWTTGAWTPGSCAEGDLEPQPAPGDAEPLPDGGLGQDEGTDQLFESCLSGGGSACDLLWEAAPETTLLQDVALTCGMRRPVEATEDRRPCDPGDATTP